MWPQLCLAFIPSFLWAVNVTLEKFFLLTYFTSYELRLSDTIIMILPFMIFLFYTNKYRKKLINIPPKTLLILCLKVFLSFTASCFFLYLLKSTDTFYTVSMVMPMFVVFSILFAYIFFNETVNMKQIMGIMLVIIGIFVISVNKPILLRKV